jgi:hypothetical protein
MKRKAVWALFALLLSVLPVAAQTSAGVYGGVTSDKQSTWMIMADYGTKVDIEPWLQTFGPETQVGVDVTVIPKNIGVVAGVNSNSFGGHIGVAASLPLGVQIRVLKHTSGAWQGIAYRNFNLTPRLYLQLWAAPATDVSTYLVGVGYTFKR